MTTTHMTVRMETRIRRGWIMRTIAEIGLLTDAAFPRFTDRLVMFGAGLLRPEYRLDGGRWRPIGRIDCTRTTDGEVECIVANPETNYRP